MADIKHTPTPWEFDGDRDEMHIHVQGGIIASIFTPDDSPCFAPENPEEGEPVWVECIANGRIIVEAVNNHERLIQRVQELEKALKSAASTAHYRGVLRGASDFCHGSFDECTNCACWKTILAGAQKEATK
jgi:hypothetical protein